METEFRRIAEITQEVSITQFRRFVKPMENQGLKMPPMDYKKESGRRIRELRAQKSWTLEALSRKTGDVLSLQRIGAYEKGVRMVGPSEAVILAKALGSRPAYIMVVDDIQISISPQEESLIKNWRKLAERDRMQVYRQVGSLALQAADPVPDARVEHMSAKGKKQPARAAGGE